MIKDVRVEVRLRNNVLYRAIFDRWGSVAAFCREKGLSSVLVGELLNLEASPFSKRGDGKTYRSYCRRIEHALGMLCEDLFPAHLYALKGTKAVMEVSCAQLPGSREFMTQLSAPRTPEEELGLVDRDHAIRKALDKLTPRQKRVMEYRFGLHDGREWTLGEVGQEFELTVESIRRIEAQALRMLRHPALAKHIKDFLPD